MGLNSMNLSNFDMIYRKFTIEFTVFFLIVWRKQEKFLVLGYNIIGISFIKINAEGFL